MRLNKLQEALNQVKSRSPRFFWTQCNECDDHFKREPMFYFKRHTFGVTPHSYRVWNCTHCCPTPEDVLLKNSNYFTHIDLSPLTPTKGS